MKKLMMFLFIMPFILSSCVLFNIQTVHYGNIMMIINESTDENGSEEYTGKISFVESNKTELNKKERINPVIPFKRRYSINDASLGKREIEEYSIGTKKDFWTYNFMSDNYNKMNTTLVAAGIQCNVWVNTLQLNRDLTRYTNEATMVQNVFDNLIYPNIVQYFYKPSDIDGNNKVNILLFDIIDGNYFGYVAGYFDPNDLYNGFDSNMTEIFYIDNTEASLDIQLSTLAHEFQHMVNFNRNVIEENNWDSSKAMVTWLDEGLSMAAEHICYGLQKDRIEFFNYSEDIKNGHPLIKWNSTLENYSLSYLFMEYLRIQSNIGNSIYKDLLLSSVNNSIVLEKISENRSISDLNNLSLKDIIRYFRAALLLNYSKGIYGFKNELGFDQISVQYYEGDNAQLYPSGTIYKKIINKYYEDSHGNNIRIYSYYK